MVACHCEGMQGVMNEAVMGESLSLKRLIKSLELFWTSARCAKVLDLVSE